MLGAQMQENENELKRIEKKQGRKQKIKKKGKKLSTFKYK